MKNKWRELSEARSLDKIFFLVKIEVTSWCLRHPFVCTYDGVTTVLRGPHDVVLPSYDHREWSCSLRMTVGSRKIRNAPMITRWRYEGYTNTPDGYTTVIRCEKTTYDVHTNLLHRVAIAWFFGMPKILDPLPMLLPNPEIVSRWLHDGSRCRHECPEGDTISPDVTNFLHRVAIGSQHRQGVTPALEYSLETQSV